MIFKKVLERQEKNDVAVIISENLKSTEQSVGAAQGA